MTRLPAAGLYVVTTAHRDLEWTVSEALAGGARVVQYRDKGDDAARRRREARVLAALCRAAGAPLIVNDDVELATEVGADGVHLGRDDTDPETARERLGARALIGVSCYDRIERARAAARSGADYVAFGSFFASPTKPDAVRAPVALLGAARAELDLPIVAIGGITPRNGARLVAAGAHFLAVATGIFHAPDPRVAAGAYARLFQGESRSASGGRARS